MGLYFGSGTKVKINCTDGFCRLIIPSPLPTVSGIILKSSDNYILKDFNGLYLIAKEDE